MQWPLARKPIPTRQIPFYNLHYLQACPRPTDPTIVWGTEVPAQPLNQFLRERNRGAKTLLSPAHLLVQAVGRALRRHPALNRRVVGRRIFSFREVNVRAMTYNRQQNEVDILLLQNVDLLSLEHIARVFWKSQLSVASGEASDHSDKARLRNWLPGPLLGWMLRAFLFLDSKFNLPKVGRIDRTACSPVIVNYLAFSGAPPMRAYKASNYPHDSSTLSVTMGRAERAPVICDGEVKVGHVAPLFVRGDHRIASAYEIGQFTETLRRLLADPAQMDTTTINNNTGDSAAAAA